MNLQHLNSIERVMDNAINLSKDKEEMPIDKWSIILKPWCDTLEGACNELKLLRPYKSVKYKALKVDLVKEWISLLGNLEGEVKKESITEIYDAIENNIDRNIPLTKQDIFTIIYFGLSALLERSKLNDYHEFYELVTVTEAIDARLNGPSSIEKLPYSVYAWRCLIAKINLKSTSFTTLKEEYNIPENYSLDTFTKNYDKAKRQRVKMIDKDKDFFKGKGNRTIGSISKSLSDAQIYFELKNDIKNLKEVLVLMDIVEKEKGRYKD